MANLLKEVLLGLLTVATHEAGHIRQADLDRIPLEFKNLREFEFFTNDMNKAGRIGISGFAAQDRAKTGRGGNIVSSLLKIDNLLRSSPDLDTIEKSRGRNARRIAQAALGGGAVMDLLRVINPDMRNDIAIDSSSTGDPMIVFRRRF